MLRLLTFSTLFPNREQPRHGIFVEQRLRHLLASGRVSAQVVAPVPWFPWRGPQWGRYGVYAAVPRHALRQGLTVAHPRYPVIPRIGMRAAPWLLARAAAPAIRRMLAQGRNFDVIDAHYFYPDGVAAAWLGARFDKPVVITARGSDINVIARYPAAHRKMLDAAAKAAALVAVSHALKDEMIRLGMDPNTISVLRNGVELTRFGPHTRQATRSRLDIEGVLLLSVGHLIEPKGHHLAIEALARLPDMQLVVVGDGEMQSELRNRAVAFGVADRVRFTGTVTQAALCDYYAAADILVLATRREGMPNVVLEAMACGTPVVATAVGGIPEIVAAPEAGCLMADRSVDALVDAITALLQRYPERSATRRYAAAFGWDETTRGQLALFEQVLSVRKSAATGWAHADP